MEDAAGVAAVIQDPLGQPIASTAVMPPAGPAGSDEVVWLSRLVAEVAGSIKRALVERW